MDSNILSSFLQAHSDQQLRDLIKAATIELESRSPLTAIASHRNGAWACGPPPTSNMMSLFAPKPRGLPIVGLKTPAGPSLVPPSKKEEPREEKEEDEGTTVLMVRSLPYKDGIHPVCDHLDENDEEVPFFKPIRAQLIAAIVPIRSSNTYVPPNGGYALIYFSNKAEAESAKASLEQHDYVVEFTDNQ